MLRLKEVRKESGLSVAKLADAAGISRRTIEDAERRGDCRMSTAYKIASVLKITLDDLWNPDAETEKAGE